MTASLGATNSWKGMEAGSAKRYLYGESPSQPSSAPREVSGEIRRSTMARSPESFDNPAPCATTFPPATTQGGLLSVIYRDRTAMGISCLEPARNPPAGAGANAAAPP